MSESSPNTKILNTFVGFTPQGENKNDLLQFVEFWTEATERVQRERSRKLARERKQQLRLHEAMDKLAPIIQATLKGAHDIASASSKVEELVPDKELRRKVVDKYAKWLTNSAEDTERTKEDFAQMEADIHRREKINKAHEKAQSGILELSQAARDGDVDAANDLVTVATLAAVLLSSAELAKADIFKSIARERTHWPVMAKYDSHWEKTAMKRVAQLDLGGALECVHVRFRQVRGTDANLPARRWAKTAVRVAEQTRCRFILIGGIVRDFGSTDAFVDFCFELGWEICDCPEWVNSVMKLKQFSQETLRDWKPVVRDLIRHQVADFHLLPEWQTQRNTATANGKTSRGEIQNAILDDIVSALGKLAPKGIC